MEARSRQVSQTLTASDLGLEAEEIDQLDKISSSPLAVPSLAPGQNRERPAERSRPRTARLNTAFPSQPAAGLRTRTAASAKIARAMLERSPSARWASTFEQLSTAKPSSGLASAAK